MVKVTVGAAEKAEAFSREFEEAVGCYFFTGEFGGASVGFGAVVVSIVIVLATVVTLLTIAVVVATVVILVAVVVLIVVIAATVFSTANGATAAAAGAFWSLGAVFLISLLGVVALCFWFSGFFCFASGALLAFLTAIRGVGAFSGRLFGGGFFGRFLRRLFGGFFRSGGVGGWIRL